MDCELAELDQLLEDEKLLILLESDLCQRYHRTTKTGRHSTPVEVILRMLTLKHLRNHSLQTNSTKCQRKSGLTAVLPSLPQPSSLQEYID
jgi:hypothetical protein